MELVTCMPYHQAIHGQTSTGEAIEGKYIVDEIWSREEFYSGRMKRYADRYGLRIELARVIDGHYITCIPNTFWLRILQRRIRNRQN